MIRQIAPMNVHHQDSKGTKFTGRFVRWIPGVLGVLVVNRFFSVLG
jgi:hypothetical protein